MSRTGEQSNEPHNRQVPAAAPRAQARSDRRHGIIFCSVVLVGASAVFAVLMLTSGSTSAPAAQSVAMSGGMPGMNHGSGQMPESAPSPTMASDMPGMDHAAADMPASTPSPTMAGDMPGMDHGSGAMAASTPWPNMAADMPGMDHGHGDTPAAAPTPTMSGDMPGMDHGSADVHGGGTEHGHTAEVAPDRPLAPVLGVFGGGASAVMLSAGLLRRKDRASSQAKAAARAVRRTQK